MSIDAYRAVWEHCQYGGSRRLVMLALADNADADKFACFPSISTIADKCKLKERRTQVLIRSMLYDPERNPEGELLIEQCAAPNRHNLFTLLLPGARKPAEEYQKGLAQKQGQEYIAPEPAQPKDKKPSDGINKILWDAFVSLTNTEPKTVVGIQSWVHAINDLAIAGCTPEQVVMLSQFHRRRGWRLTPHSASKHLHEIEADKLPINTEAPSAEVPSKNKYTGHNMSCLCRKCQAADRIINHRANCICSDCIEFRSVKDKVMIDQGMRMLA